MAATAREELSTSEVADNDLLSRLESVLRPDQVRGSATEVHLYRHDASNLSGRASVVCFVESTADVQAVVRTANEFDVPFVARGSGTGLAGGQWRYQPQVIHTLNITA